jgi:hypothetical protein
VVGSRGALVGVDELRMNCHFGQDDQSADNEGLIPHMAAVVVLLAEGEMLMVCEEVEDPTGTLEAEWILEVEGIYRMNLHCTGIRNSRGI